MTTPARTESPRSELAFRIGTPLLALALCLLFSDPTLVGIWEDDAIYVSTAAALAQGEGPRAEILPGSPTVAKYPILYPLVLSLFVRAGLDPAGHLCVWAILVFQALLFAASLWVVLCVLFPR
ncbi:hypothetical protein ACFL59_14945, partial [Planctomycetota bacterium]